PAPCAASAAVELARIARPSFKGLDAVVVGRSALVGKAIALLLLQSKGDAPTPTLCHTATADLGAHTRRADLLFAAAGRAGLIRGDMIKKGAVVIDAGINETQDRKTVGDVAFDEAKEVAGVITPVPGGVGPVCHSILLRNIAASANRALAREGFPEPRDRQVGPIVDDLPSPLRGLLRGREVDAVDPELA